MFIRVGGLQRHHFYFILTLVCLLSAAGCSKPADEAASPAATKAAVAKEKPVAIARSRFGDITKNDLAAYAQTGLCPALNEIRASTQTAPLTGARLVPVIQWIASRQAAEAELKTKNDPKLNTLCYAGFNQELDSLLLREIVRTEIRDRSTTPTQEELLAYYKKHEPLYVQPFSATMRMLLLQTYEPYIIQSGDTLEAIAQRISGDPAEAANIRADIPGRPLRREPGKLENPLYPGEKLLVPMNAARKAEVRARLEAIVKDVRGIKDLHDRDMRFESLAKKYDESGFAGEITNPLPTGTRKHAAPMPQIMAAVLQTTVGQVSPVIQTKHGFQVIEVIDRVETHSLPLDNPLVHKDLMQRMLETRKNRAVEDLMVTLMNNPKLKVDYNLIGRGNSLTTDTVVAVLGDTKLLWNDLKGTWNEEHQPVGETPIRKMLYLNQPFAMMLFRDHLRPQMEDPSTELGRRLQCIRTAMAGSTYLTHLATEDIRPRLTKDRAKEYYEKNKANFIDPAKVAFDSAIWPVTNANGLKPEERKTAAQGVLKQLQEALKTVKTEKDFMALKARLDTLMKAENAPQMAAVEPMPVTALSPEMQKLFAGVAPGQWTEPAIFGDMCAASFLVRTRVPEKVASFESSIDRINRDLFMSEYAGVNARLEKEYAKRAGAYLLAK